MRSTILLFFIAFGCVPSWAQKYSVDKSYIKFYSHAAIEDITAENTKASSLFNESTGEVVFSIPIKEFEFAKSLMRQHFNDKYMESEAYPKAMFQGKILGYQPKVTGEQTANAVGKLTMHGVEQNVDIVGTVQKSKDMILMKAKFVVKLADYKIKIPQVFWQNIAEQVDVTVEFNYKAL
jgi:polyisoprenoid-binding protein YceI